MKLSDNHRSGGKIVNDKIFVEQIELLHEAQQTVEELSHKLQEVSDKMFQVYSTAKYEESLKK